MSSPVPAAAAPPYDAVLFDLDGTLVATDRFWVEAARAGAQRAFAELGIEREAPTGAQWMSLVGYPLADGMRRLFPDLAPTQLERVIARCVEEEEAALRAGGAALLPGVAETLDTLKSAGARLGIASNCSRGYLDQMLHGLELALWVDEARCLASPGVRTKADMIRDLLETFGTRSAVFVGDRRGDGEAAHENAIPRIHYAGAFADPSDEEFSEARIVQMGELVPLLDQRGEGIARALARLGADRPSGARAFGVSGPVASGKSLWARDAARWLEAHGRRARVIEIDDYLIAPDKAQTRVADPLGMSYDVAAVVDLLSRHARGERVDELRDSEALRQRLEGERRRGLAPDEVLILCGPYLLDPRLRAALPALVYLAADDETCLKRLAARDVPLRGPEVLIQARRVYLPLQRQVEEKADWAGVVKLAGADVLRCGEATAR